MATWDPSGSATTVTTAATFIPEIWSDEIVAAYKQSLVMANLVATMNHRGKKGDRINIPKPTRGTAVDKTAGTAVSVISNTESNIPVDINVHKQYSRLIEDLVDVQALESLRRFYVDDAGYANAIAVDSSLHALAATWGGSTAYGAAAASVSSGFATTAWDPAANTNTGNGTALDDYAIRHGVRTLDDSDAPQEGRFLVVPPVAKRDLLGIANYVTYQNTGEAGSANSVRNGFVGDVYGTQVYVSTNCATVTATDASTEYRASLMFQRNALLLVEQLGIRVQTQYKQEWLADLLTADIVYGVANIRAAADESAIAFLSPA